MAAPTSTVAKAKPADVETGNVKIHPDQNDIELTPQGKKEDTPAADASSAAVKPQAAEQVVEKADEKKDEKKDEEAAAAKKKKEDDAKKKKEDELDKKFKERASFLRVVRNAVICGIIFVVFYIFLLFLSIQQVNSAMNAPVSRHNDYSASNYGWETTYFSASDFVERPSVSSGRLSTGKNIKLTDRLRLEVHFTNMVPQASGGSAGVQLTMIIPPSWKDENKPPKPWFSIVCQFGSAVIQINPATFNPSQYVAVLPNGGLQLTYGSYNAYPFDVYKASAQAWCYYDATAANKLAPKPPTKAPTVNKKLAPTKYPTPVPDCWAKYEPSRNAMTDPCCLNLYVINDPAFGTYAVNVTTQFHKFGCCSGIDACCSPPSGADDDSVSNQAGGPVSQDCIAATSDPANPDVPSPCDPSAGGYDRTVCATKLWPGPGRRRLYGGSAGDGTYRDADAGTDPSNLNPEFDYQEWFDGPYDAALHGGDGEGGRGLAAAKYPPIAPNFVPDTGYLNFELAMELSDAGIFKHDHSYNDLKISQIRDFYDPGLGLDPVPIVYDSISFPKVNIVFYRAPINKVFAMYILVALWFVCAAHTSANWTFYMGIKKVDAAALVTGAVTVLFALPAIRNSLPGAPPIGAIIDFAAYFWCIIICICHVLCVAYLWLDNTFFNPQPKAAVKPAKVIITTEADEKKKEEDDKEKQKKKDEEMKKKIAELQANMRFKGRVLGLC